MGRECGPPLDLQYADQEPPLSHEKPPHKPNVAVSSRDAARLKVAHRP